MGFKSAFKGLIFVNQVDLIGHGWRTSLGRLPKLSINFEEILFLAHWNFKKTN